MWQSRAGHILHTPEIKFNFPHSPRLGTRGSLLATTQAGQVRDQLFQMTGVNSELFLVKTQGDQITDKPLWQIDGKDFFTKELDQALLSGEVDFVVHSLKDLSTQRPEGIVLAAVTKRLYPNDILLCRRETAEYLCRDKSPKKFVVGTSSPRRITNIGKELAAFLPNPDSISVELKNLRGNVNTRLEKMLKGEFDAIILAMTGLERLCQSLHSRVAMSAMLQQCEFMILPQTIFPTAAGQGALGIECRSDDLIGQKWLSTLHHQETANCIKKEREIFRTYGGGCHLAVGIHVRKVREHLVIIENGVHQDKIIKKMTSNIHRPVCPNGPVFLGMPGANEPLSIRDNFFIKSSVAKMPNQTLKENGHCLISVGHAIDAFKQFPAHLKQGVWAAGTRTHQKLASHGYWVNANAEGLGQQIVEDLSHSLAVKEMRSTWNNQWYHFGPESNETSHPNEPTIQNISSYQREMLPLDQETIKQLNQCQCFYWTSFSQYKAYLKAVPSIANKMHCCGPGKTFDEFSNHQININLFISLEEFKQWTSAH